MADNKAQVLQVTPSEAAEMIQYRYLQRRDEKGVFRKMRTLFMKGYSGIGKTDVVRQASAELDRLLHEKGELKKGESLKCMTLCLQFLETPDFMGLPFIDKDNVTRYARPAFFPQEGHGILFLDEVNRCNRDLRSGLLTLLQDREINGHKLPEDWLIVAAGNPTDDENGNYETVEFDDALKDRLAEMWFKFDLSEFIKYLVTRYTEKNPVVYWIKSHGQKVIAPHLRGEKTKGDKRSMITPRALEYTVVALLPFGNRAEDLVKGEMPFKLVAAELGTEGASAFFSFLHDIVKLNAEQVMEKYDEADVGEKLAILKDAGRVDTLQTLATDVCQYIVKKGPESFKKSEKYTGNFVKYLKAVPKDIRVQFFIKLDELTQDEKLLDCLVKQCSSDKEISKFFSEMTKEFDKELKEEEEMLKEVDKATKSKDKEEKKAK
jgi:hypothetical protein